MKFERGLQAEVLEQIVNESYEKAQQEKGLVPISTASVETDGIMPEKNKPYSFKITVEVKPTVKIDNYKGLVLERETIEITDEHIEAVLKQKQEEHAEFLPVTGRNVVKGDWVLLDGETLLDGKPVHDLSGHMLQAGSENLPEKLNEALIGISIGEEKRISYKIEDDKEVTYRFKVKEIKEKRLLIVNDEFAKSFGGFQNLEELRNDIRKKLEAIRDIRIKEDLKRQISDKLVANVEVEFPPQLVERQKQYIKTLARVRKDNDAEKLSDKELEKIAVKKLKESFALDEIAEKENIAVSQNELEEVKARISKDRKDTKIDMDNIKFNLLHEKVLEFLLSHATINDKEKSLIVKPDEVNLIKSTST